MLLSERERIETIEKQMLFQQKQWNDVWAEAHHDDLAQFKEESAKIQSELSKLREGGSVESVGVAQDAPAEPEVEPASEKSPVDVEAILRDNFAKNPNKLNYFYILTPKGIAEKTKLTLTFMKRKMKEYDELKKEMK